MNQNTTESLIKFIDAVENLAAALAVQVGIETAAQTTNTCEQLKRAIKKDETLNFPK